MLPRHAYLSATMLALAATMSEEDAPVVPSPDDLDAPPEDDDGASSYDKAHSYLGDDLDYLWSKGKQECSHYDIDAGQGHGYDGRYEPPEMTLKRSAFCRPRPEQRERKKARAKRKAKKGWA